MANNKKKNIALHHETYNNLSTLAAQMRIDNGGKFVSMSEAVGVLLDERKIQIERIQEIALKIATHIAEKQIGTAKHAKVGTVNPDHIDPDMLADDWAMYIEQQFEESKTEPEPTQPVIIKQSDGSLYLEKAFAHNHNFEMTHYRNDAMVFDSSDQAKAFLRQCGHEVGNWIIEPA